MKNNFKKPISVLLSMLIAAASSAIAFSTLAETATDPVEPTVYRNTFDEEYVSFIYGTDTRLYEYKDSNGVGYEYLTDSETGNGYIKYFEGDNHHWYNRPITLYNPSEASRNYNEYNNGGQYPKEAYRTACAIRYEDSVSEDMEKLFKVSFRYNCTWLNNGDEIWMGLKMTHINSYVGNDVNSCSNTATPLYTISSQTSWDGGVTGWTSAEAYCILKVPANLRNGQFGVSLYLNGMGSVLLDDVVVEDYTDTDALFANLIVDGNEAGAKKLDSASDLPKYVGRKIVQGGWYTDAAMTESFDFNSYDISNGKQINLYAATAGAVYENTFDENYVSFFYDTDARVYEYKDSNGVGYEYLTDSETGNGYIKYFEGDNHHWYNRPITLYNPSEASRNYNEYNNGGQYPKEAYRTACAIRYEDSVSEDMEKLFKVSFRYNCTWLNNGDEIWMGLRMTHINSYVGNDVNSCSNTATPLYTISSQTSWDGGVTGWTSAEAYCILKVPANLRNGQFGVSLYLNGMGSVLLDDVVIEDYTDTDYSLVNTYVDGSLDSQVITPLTKFNPPAKEGCHWYNDETCTTKWTAYGSNRTAGSAENLSVNVYGKVYDKGDWNGDGIFDDTDFKELRRRILFDEAYISWLDMDSNGKIDICDLVLLKKNC